MTGFSHSLKKEKKSNFDFERVKAMGGLKIGLGTAFPKGKVIGEAYHELQYNIFSFNYIRAMQLRDGVETKKIVDVSRS